MVFAATTSSLPTERRPALSRSPATSARTGASDDQQRPLPEAPGRAALARRPKPTCAAEAEFLAIGDGTHTWLVEAAAAGTSRIKTKMAQAVTLARLHGWGSNQTRL